MEIALAVLAVTGAAYAVAIALAAVTLARKVPLLTRLTPPPPIRWPRVSVVIPACNEEATLERALRSRLDEGYPHIEYIVVDDRSTDGTGAIIDRLAAEDARIVPVHVAALPDGWLGKVHAMQVALERATGAWVLFSDADVHHVPGTLRRVIAHAERHAIDHVAVFPTVFSGSFWLDAVLTTLLRVIIAASRAWRAPDPRSRISVGGGVFNLVRRSALDRAGGLEPLRMEVVDDAALGQLVKWAGGRACVLNGRDAVGLQFYASVGEVVRGMEKNAFALLGRFSVPRFVVGLGVLVGLELGGFAALASSHAWVVALGAVAIAALTVAQVVAARWLRRPVAPALLWPVGIGVFLYGAVRSMVLTVWRGGIEWRGTTYSLAALRRGRRLVTL